MLIKSAEDHSRRLNLLDALLNSPRLNYSQKERLRKELERRKVGIQGERDAAHYIDTHLADSDNHVVIHDLRFEIDGAVAQIDHLIINRMFVFYLLETKNFGGNLMINEHGEFTAEYGREKFGIESPIEQSKRHEVMLVRLLDELGITGRFNKRPTMFHAVLLHPRGIIKRPPAEKFDSSNVMKADQFETWRQRNVDSISVASMLRLGANVVASDTIATWGRAIAARHMPTSPLELPEWLNPQPVRPSPAPKTAPIPAEPAAVAHASATVKPVSTSAVTTAAGSRKLICANCGEKISFAEGKFCWNNEKRFGGLQYCRTHQAAL